MWLPYRKLVFYGAYLRQVQKEADRRLLAEYDLSSGQLTWKKESPTDLSRRVAWTLWSLGLVILPLLAGRLIRWLGYDAGRQPRYPDSYLGSLGAVALPLLLGLLLALVYEVVSSRLRAQVKAVPAPDQATQRAILSDFRDQTLRFNGALPGRQRPYLVNGLLLLGYLFGLVPLVWGLYWQPVLLSSFVARLGILTFLLSLLPSFILTLLLKSWVIQRLLRDLVQRG
ncbi:hypothetical protein [Abiotrophia defectiva]